MIEIVYLVFMAICNRARGSKLYEHTGSTTVARLVSTLAMAIGTSLMLSGESSGSLATSLWLWASLMLWCVFAWDNYWSAAIGNPTDITKKAFPPVDWVMSKLPAMPLRLWGLIAMSLRQTMAAIPIIGLAVLSGHSSLYALFTPFLGLPYFIFGFFSNPKAIMRAEYAVGAMLGILFMLVV